MARRTPTPQPSATASTARRRGTRSASRDVEEPLEAAKPTRRSARQASVDSNMSVSEQEGKPARRTKRKAKMEAAGDLATVEEVDTLIEINDAPATPPRQGAEIAVLHRSPGAVSEMSGTTAISSFSLVEAETLDPRFILRHLPRLHQDVEDFLNQLVPDNGRIEDDNRHIHEMQMPDSDFVADYNDFNHQLSVRLPHFRGEHQQYIRPRAVHAALFGPNRNAAASRTGLDLVLYQANLIVFAKQMIHSDRNDKAMWGAIRELDNLFPTLFLPTLIPGSDPAGSPAGDSALLEDTFELALELRTQLAILFLERGSTDPNFDPDAALGEVFFYLHPSQRTNQSDVIRGWSISALGGEDSALPEAFRGKVVKRLNDMRTFFLTDQESIERGDVVDIDGLGANYPWHSTILRLLGWVRLRNQELQTAIRQQRGVAGIMEKVKAEIQQPTEGIEPVPPVLQASPRKKRTSFGRDRRRSSRKFDPNAEVNDEVLNKLIARERGAAVQLPEATFQREPHVAEKEVEIPGNEQEAGQDDHFRPAVPEVPRDEDDWLPPQDDEQEKVMEAAEVGADVTTAEPAEQIAESSRPPQSTRDLVKLLKESRKTDKENRVTSLFQRQATAQRVDFGDGFDESQPTPVPSGKGKEPQQSSSKKRRRETVEISDDEDAFETRQRTANVKHQRAKAKRVRVDPSSSGAPTSHQPRARDEGRAFERVDDEEVSEPEAPEMTEEAPPRSSLQTQKALARANTNIQGRAPRRARVEWTVAEEEAFVEYMAEYPQQYSRILALDKINDEVLQKRTQVDLKDKARSMAVFMIKSRGGLRPGFRDVITPAVAQNLRDKGYEW